MIVIVYQKHAMNFNVCLMRMNFVMPCCLSLPTSKICLMPWTLPRLPTSWVFILFVTDTGTFKLHVQQAVSNISNNAPIQICVLIGLLLFYRWWSLWRLGMVVQQLEEKTVNSKPVVPFFFCYQCHSSCPTPKLNPSFHTHTPQLYPPKHTF